MAGADILGYRGKRVVISGGSSGMGAATARILGELGAEVHIVDIQPPTESCAGVHQCDLSDFAAVRSTAAALRALAPIDFLFACAGLPPHVKGPLYCIRVNYIGARLFVEELLPALADGAGIALISSAAGMAWQKNLAANLAMLAITDPDEAYAWCEADPTARVREAYSTSKEMLVVWAQHAAVELGNSRRIRINAIGPCPTKTAFVDLSADLMTDEFIAGWPFPSLGRMATAEEQAWPLILLNCSLMGAVSGAFLYTDQGFASGIFTGAISPAFLGG